MASKQEIAQIFSDIAANLERATEFRDRLRAGEDMGELAEQAGESVDTLDLSVAEINQISTAYAGALQTAEPGDVLGPLRFDGQSANTLGVVQVTALKGGGTLKFEDVRDQIESRLRSTRLTESLVEALRERTYVDIRLAGAR